MSSPSPPKKPSSSDLSEQILSRLLSLQISPSRLTATPSYVLCDTPSTVTSAISALKNCTSIVVDCEGLNLGVDGGSLSLICIRPTTYASLDLDVNYLFDIIALTGVISLQPLYTLLTSPEILKIVYDGRMDFCALFHSSPSTTISPVIDLELVDVQSRSLRGETRDDQTRRQRRCFLPRQVYGNKWKYDKVHVLQGLGMCLVDHGCLAQNPKKDVDHDSWMIRPFTLLHLEYAAHDLVLIDILLSCFISDGYIPSLSLEANAPILYSSQKYIEIWADAPPRPDDRFRSHPLLPLGILFDSNSDQEQTCAGCKRSLSVDSFPPPARKAGVSHCLICLAVPQWLNLMRIRDEEREKRKMLRENKELREGEATAALFGGAGAGRGAGPSIPPPYSSPNSRGHGRGIVSSSSPLSPPMTSNSRGVFRVRGRGGESASRGRGGGRERGGRVSPPTVPPSTRGRGTEVGRGRGGGQSHIPAGNGRGAGPLPPSTEWPFRVRGRGAEPTLRGRGRGGRGGRISPPSPQLDAFTATPSAFMWSPTSAPILSPQPSLSSQGGQPSAPPNTRGRRGSGGERGSRGRGRGGESSRGYSRGRGGASVAPAAAGL